MSGVDDVPEEKFEKNRGEERGGKLQVRTDVSWKKRDRKICLFLFSQVFLPFFLSSPTFLLPKFFFPKFLVKLGPAFWKTSHAIQRGVAEKKKIPNHMYCVRANSVIIRNFVFVEKLRSTSNEVFILPMLKAFGVVNDDPHFIRSVFPVKGEE
jgi:hypothetical protein